MEGAGNPELGLDAEDPPLHTIQPRPLRPSCRPSVRAHLDRDCAGSVAQSSGKDQPRGPEPALDPLGGVPSSSGGVEAGAPSAAGVFAVVSSAVRAAPVILRKARRGRDRSKTATSSCPTPR